MKCVNLYYLYTASKVNIKEFRSYEKILSNRCKISSLGDREKGSIFHLVDYLLLNGCMFEKLNNFYYSYTIPHIGKEFDLLKISDDKILNIELKSEDVGLERIKTQLLRNYNYLKYLSKEMYLFTFISNTKEFYKLDENLNLVEDYKNGKRVFDFIIGQIMKKTRGRANPVITSRILKEELEK